MKSQSLAPRGRLSAALALVLLSVGGSALAEPHSMVACRATLPEARTQWARTVAVPRFNPALGALRSVEVRIELAGHYRVSVENLGRKACVASTSLCVGVSLADAAGAPLAAAGQSRDFASTLGGFDGTRDFAGTSGTTGPWVPFSATGTGRVAVGLARFVGKGSLELSACACGQSTFAGPSCYALATDITMAANVVVVYNYDGPGEPEREH